MNHDSVDAIERDYDHADALARLHHHYQSMPPVAAMDVRIAGYDAVYVAHAEALRVPWLTADRRVLRRLGKDARVQALVR